MTVAIDSKYRVERGDPVADRERILRLWDRCGFLTGAAASSRYDWFYLKNPVERGRVYLLLAGEELVGAVGAGTREMVQASAATLRAALLVDFVVDSAHRSMFPALALQRAAREHELKNVRLIYGLPDSKAVPVFRRLGCSTEFPSGNHVRVLRSAGFIRRRLPRMPAFIARAVGACLDRARLLLPWLICRLTGIRSGWQRGFPTGCDELWQRITAESSRATGIRSREFLAWRFCHTQQPDWQVLTVSDRRGRLSGYFVCLREGDELHVSDLLLAESAGGFVPLQALAMEAWRQGIKTVRIVFGGSARMHRRLARAGYLLRDQRPCFIIQAAGADDRPLPAEWWLTRADEDV